MMAGHSRIVGKGWEAMQPPGKPTGIKNKGIKVMTILGSAKREGWLTRGFDSPPREQIRSMHLSPRAHPRIQLDLPEGRLVAVDILLQQSEQRLGLLRAQVNALKVADLDLRLILLLHGAKHEEEIPHVHSHLHAVGIVFPVVGGINQLDIGLWRNAHVKKCNDFQGRKGSRRRRIRAYSPCCSSHRFHSMFIPN
jgi:hypothetical protein